MFSRLRFLVAAGAFPAFAQTTTVPGQTGSAGDVVANYQPITAKRRLHWFAWTTFGPAGIGGNLVSAGLGTALNRPREYGPHWEGFGDRIGMGLAGNATSNAMEAGLGSLWGEDPRYFRAAGQPFGRRVGHVLKSAFLATNRDGHSMPAWSRYMAISGSNFL